MGLKQNNTRAPVVAIHVAVHVVEQTSKRVLGFLIFCDLTQCLLTFAFSKPKNRLLLLQAL